MMDYDDRVSGRHGLDVAVYCQRQANQSNDSEELKKQLAVLTWIAAPSAGASCWTERVRHSIGRV